MIRINNQQQKVWQGVEFSNPFALSYLGLQYFTLSLLHFYQPLRYCSFTKYQFIKNA